MPDATRSNKIMSSSSSSKSISDKCLYLHTVLKEVFTCVKEVHLLRNSQKIYTILLFDHYFTIITIIRIIVEL